LPNREAVIEEIYLGLRNRHWVGDHLRHEVNEIEAKRRRVTHADLSGVGLAGHEALHQKLTLFGDVLQLLREREGIPWTYFFPDIVFAEPAS